MKKYQIWQKWNERYKIWYDSTNSGIPAWDVSESGNKKNNKNTSHSLAKKHGYKSMLTKFEILNKK